MHFTDIKPIGIGIAADLGGIRPDWRKFIDCADPTMRFDFMNIAATWDQVAKVKHHLSHLVERGFDFVTHPINFNPVDPRDESDRVVDGIRELALYTRAHWAAQDVGAWMWNDLYMGEFLLPAILDEDSAREVAGKAVRIGEVMPCPYLLENPPVNFSVESIHMLDFMAAVSREADCGLVLDIGHLLGYQLATGRSLRDMPLDRFPFERVIEIHLAGLMRRVSGAYESYFDHHGYPVHPMCWEFLSETVGRMSNLKGITLEQESCDDDLVEQHVRRLRSIVREQRVFADAA